MNTETKTKHKRYDEAFKKSAVEHWLISGKSARQIAAELGINVQNLPKWKQKFKELPTGQVRLCFCLFFVRSVSRRWFDQLEVTTPVR
jgi:transposase-like protein